MHDILHTHNYTVSQKTGHPTRVDDFAKY